MLHANANTILWPRFHATGLPPSACFKANLAQVYLIATALYSINAMDPRPGHARALIYSTELHGRRMWVPRVVRAGYAEHFLNSDTWFHIRVVWSNRTWSTIMFLREGDLRDAFNVIREVSTDWGLGYTVNLWYELEVYAPVFTIQDVWRIPPDEV